MAKNRGPAYTFDDVLMAPNYSTLKSRSDVKLGTRICRDPDIHVSIPIIASPMKDVTEGLMAGALALEGAVGVIHRFQSVQDQKAQIALAKNSETGDKLQVGAAIGVKDDWLDRAAGCIAAGATFLMVDIAHGNHLHQEKLIREFRKHYPDYPIIAANIADYDGAKRVCYLGFNGMRCGIGGGCLAPGTRILMANGIYKNIIDIKPGEEVINRYGKPVKVKKVFSTGYKKVVSVRNSNFYKDTVITPDHRCLIGDCSTVSEETLKSKGYKKVLEWNGEGSKIKWQPVGDFKQSVFLFPTNIEYRLPDSFEIDINNYFQRETEHTEDYKRTIESSYELGYIFGTFLGDGCSMLNTSNRARGKSTIGSVSWYFGLQEKHIAEKLNKCILKITGKAGQITSQDNFCLVRLYSKQWAHLFDEFGKQEVKRLPEKYYCTDLNYLNGIWDGLVDSDGYNDASREVVTNTSTYILELASFIQSVTNITIPFIVRRGLRSSAKVTATNPGYEVKTLANPKVRIVQDNDTSYQVIKNTSVKQETDEAIEVWDIEVDDDSHSFIADNMIVHNSLCTTRIMTGCGVPALTSIEECCKAVEDAGMDIPVIYDGGIRVPSDIVKALAFGASAVIVGSIFAGCVEAPGEAVFNPALNRWERVYRGSASMEIKGGDRHVEGANKIMHPKGSVKSILKHLKDGIKSGISYLGADDIPSLQEKAEYYIVTQNGLLESHAHGLRS